MNETDERMDRLIRADSRRHADRLPQPPALDALVGAATAPRSHAPRLALVAASVAAVVVLSGATVGLVAAARHRTSPHASSAAGKSLTVDGHRYVLNREISWSGAILDATHPNELTILPHWATPGGCGRPYIAVEARQSATSVQLTARQYDPYTPPNVNCAAIGYVVQPVQVNLAAALQARPLIDATTGQRHVVLDQASLPRLAFPVGAGTFSAAPVTWDDRTMIATETFTAPDGSAVTATFSADRAELAPGLKRTGAALTIAFRPATFLRDPHNRAETILRWQPGRTMYGLLESATVGRAVLLALARSAH